MRFIADFHIHSHFSIATSKQLAPEFLDEWARRKGISLVGTGDFTHPGWLEELREKLEPAESGLFRLKKEFRRKPEVPPVPTLSPEVRFMLSAEISNIYKKAGRVRKVHNVILAPDFETVERIRSSLLKRGANLTSDGRPIMGLDSRDLMEISLEASPRVGFIPAHIWTPWFSVLGSKSGFDTVSECYSDLTPHILAVETGLSTDPPMHWACSFLDDFTLVSNSDAHSPEKLGRNANLLDCDLDYDAVLDAVRAGDPDRFSGTIDLFPQEGKYHYDGHRKCGVRWDPLETLRHSGRCPECGRPVTVGVMHRVARLADRDDPLQRPRRLNFSSIIPLKEILSELLGKGPASRRVDQEYREIIRRLGPELYLLLDIPIDDLRAEGRDGLAEAVRRMRERRVLIQEGYDGEYGVIQVFRKDEERGSGGQTALFASAGRDPGVECRGLINFDLGEFRRLAGEARSREPEQLSLEQSAGPAVRDPGPPAGLNPEQRAAAEFAGGPALILAGPGTGKTRTLTRRVAHLIQERGIAPEKIMAVTFTNKAAGELRDRLEEELSGTPLSTRPLVCTFHSWGHRLLRRHAPHFGRTADFTLLDETDRRRLLAELVTNPPGRLPGLAESISRYKRDNAPPDAEDASEPSVLFRSYEDRLRELNLFDFDDCVHRPVELLRESSDIRESCRARRPFLLIDEYQDINTAQYRLVRLLAPGKDAELCAVGDPDQAIYGFRGADASHIQNFLRDYPGAAVFHLTRSYRCTETILRASGEILRSGGGRREKLTGGREGVKITIAPQASDRAEAEFTARTIEALMGGLRFFSMDSDITTGHGEEDIGGLSDIAVLCRTREQMRPIEKAFDDHAIPCQVVGEKPFFQREPAHTLLTLYRFGADPASIWLKSRVSGLGGDRPHLLRDIPGIVRNCAPEEALDRIIEGFFPEADKQATDDLVRLKELAREFKDDPEGFSGAAALGTGADTFQPTLESVALLTLHAAKGLEFSCVFIPGCEDGLLPYSQFGRDSDREEERRLLYVGMTRAKKRLFLSHAARRRMRGRELRLPRSPFLDAIEVELIRKAEADGPRSAGTPSQMNLFRRNNG